MADAIDQSDLPKYFSDEDEARALLEKMRWGGQPACPRCGGLDPYKITPKAGSSTRKGLYKCKACRKPFTVTVGTIFEDSHMPAPKWLWAMHLMCTSKDGLSAHELHRLLSVTYKSAWFMAHRLGHATKKSHPIAQRDALLPHLPMKLEEALEEFLRVKPSAKPRRKASSTKLMV